MAKQMEYSQVGKREALADIIANVESDATPFKSMAAKRKKPGNVEQSWQVEAYKKKGHRGVRDGQPATGFSANSRDRIYAVGQKTWDPRGVSDFAEESEVAGVSKGEMAKQVADAFVTVGQTIERRCLSNEECKLQDESDPTGANETRGAFKWVDKDAQALHPVPEKFRPNTNQLYTGSLANYNENVLKGLARAAWKRRLGNSVRLKGFLGIDIKAKTSEFTRYDDTVANKESVRTFNRNAESSAFIEVIDRLTFDTGTIDLFASAHIMTDADTGEDTAYTHSSAIFLDMEKVGLAFQRMPRVYKLPYDGGGYSAVVDAIFMLMMDNPAGCFSCRINS